MTKRSMSIVYYVQNSMFFSFYDIDLRILNMLSHFGSYFFINSE